MEPVVTLEGVQKLPNTRQRQNAASNNDRTDISAVPVDGHSLLCVGLDRETLLVAGVGNVFSGGWPAVLNDDPKATVSCTVAVLQHDGRMKGNKTPFVAVLSLPVGLDIRPERLTIRCQGHSHPYGFKYQADDLKSFFGKVSEVASQAEPDVIDSLVQVLLNCGATPEVMDTTARLVDGFSGRDGFVEILGSFDEGDTYLQGWAKAIPAGTCRVFVLGDRLQIGAFTSGLFERKDTGGKAVGFSGLLTVEGGTDVQSLRKIFVRSRAGWNAVHVHERKSVLPVRALPSHIRSLLPKLSPAGDGRALLEEASKRFDGRETVSELDVPVRVGIDFSACVDRAGALLSGWLLDPEERVDTVLFRSDGKSCRLDARWTNQRRPDVTSAFETLSPFLTGPDAKQRHGFLVHVPAQDGVVFKEAYLELVLKDGRSAFAPIALGRASLKPALRRLVSGLDPSTAFRPDVLERHFLPFVQVAEAPDPAVSQTYDLGPFPESAVLALVIGLDDDFERSRVLLSLCALDPSLKDLPIVLAISDEMGQEQIEDFRRVVGFFGLAVRLVLVNHAGDALDAIQAGASEAPCDTIVCLSSAVLPRAPGWLETLHSAFQAHDEAPLVAPTILYEDDTIRWGGAWIEMEDGRHQVKQHYLGYPRRTLLGAETTKVAAVPFDCCILSRSALAEAGGFSRNYLGTDEKGLDAALRLKLSGVGSLWVPQVEMIHADDGAPANANWKKLVAEIDRRSFDRFWSPVLPELVEARA
ncbi:hypothetical protein FIV00_08710 [Labrenzia sp. THAF82]|uniref:glycosyltransferase family 2 protein n=1 Tax=Labrenzia sp. THAF82 TaxID=2587861 RepID=UPI001267DE06|nr:hypothetical protein [Labrenzia sp. THAF82]QFT30552.1 hypothetical protein FIV00_08710 [Labrenzia sp. THAF82]